MRLLFILAILTTGGLLCSCTNCDNKKKTNEKIHFDDASSISNKDSIDSTNIKDTLNAEDSLSVNIYEVVEEDNVESNDDNSPTVNVSRRGEKNTQTIIDDFALQGNGIGVVRIGTDIKKLPHVAKGLYDKKKIEKGELLLYTGNELILEVMYNKRTNLINSIRVTSASIKTEDGISQFMNYNALMKNEKARKAIGNKNKYNLDAFIIDGITYELEENMEGEKYVSAIIIK